MVRACTMVCSGLFQVRARTMVCSEVCSHGTCTYLGLFSWSVLMFSWYMHVPRSVQRSVQSSRYFKVRPSKIKAFQFRFQMVFDKMAAICPDFKWSGFQISDPLNNLAIQKPFEIRKSPDFRSPLYRVLGRYESSDLMLVFMLLLN